MRVITSKIKSEAATFTFQVIIKKDAGFLFPPLGIHLLRFLLLRFGALGKGLDLGVFKLCETSRFRGGNTILCSVCRPTSTVLLYLQLRMSHYTVIC